MCKSGGHGRDKADRKTHPTLNGSRGAPFLQAARLALRLAGRIVGPVFLEKHGPRVENFGFNFKELGKWCNKELRATNVLTTMVLNAPRPSR